MQKGLQSIEAIGPKMDATDIWECLLGFKVLVSASMDALDHVGSREAYLLALNLLPRMFSRVYASGPPIEGFLPPSHAFRILHSSEAPVDFEVAFGEKASGRTERVCYAGGIDWTAYVSAEDPCAFSANDDSSVVLGKIFGSALAVGEAFKSAFQALIPSTPVDHLMYDIWDLRQTDRPRTEPRATDPLTAKDLLVVGMGSIANAFIYNLRFRPQLSGRFTLVDPDSMDASNEQRYVFGFPETRGRAKIEVAVNSLAPFQPFLEIRGAQSKVEQYLASGCLPVTEVALTATDNADSRMNVQASLPRILLNAWMEPSSSALRYGVGRHVFGSDQECLICSYFPTQNEPSQEEIYARRLGWTSEEIVERLRDGRPVSLDEAQRVARAIGQDPGRFLSIVGRPFVDLLHAQCGYLVPEEGDRLVAPPVPHVPVLAAVLSAADFLGLLIDNVDRPAQVPARLVFDGMGIPRNVEDRKYPPHPDCICRDEDYQEAYRELWIED